MRTALAFSVCFNILFIIVHVGLGLSMSDYSQKIATAQSHIYYGATMSELPAEVSDRISKIPELRIEEYAKSVPRVIIPSNGQLFVYENMHDLCYIGAEKSGNDWIIRGTYWQGT